LLPDLIVAEALTLQNFSEVTGAINFTTAISNIGYGPLEIYASRQWSCDSINLSSFEVCENGQYPIQQVRQLIYRKLPDEQVGSSIVAAGFMEYQNTPNLNNRPQISKWVETSIRIKGADANPLNWPVVVSENKTANCIENTLQCTDSNLVCAYEDDVNSVNTLPNSRLGKNYICNSNSAGIAVGYSHLNTQNVEAQRLQFSASTCNGNYYLVTQFDPDSLILESNEFNNVSVVEIQLTEQVDDCCTANFSVVQVEMNGSFIRFEDLTVPIPNSWLWDFGDGNTSNMQFPVNQYATPGEYTISLTTENGLGCTSTITKTITVQDVNVSVNQFENVGFNLSLSGNKYIQLSLATSKNVILNLLSVDGREIENIYGNIRLSSGLHNKEIPDVPKGIYLVQAIIDGVSHYKKFIRF